MTSSRDAALRQEIRFARTVDGLQIAYAVAGQGYPLVRTANWLTNVELDWRLSSIGAMLAGYGRRRRMVRYNPRGYGRSEGEATELSLDTFLADLEAVVDAAGLRRFALSGGSGGAPIAIAYAARHPERVSHLVIAGGYARGLLHRDPTPDQRARFEATVKLVEVGWGEDNPSIRQLLTTEFFPDATLEQIRELNELQRLSAAPRQAARMLNAYGSLDVAAMLPAVRAPTLVLHCLGDVRVPVSEGRLIASSIPGARFVPIDSPNHMPLPGEREFARMFEEVDAFLASVPTAVGGSRMLPDSLTPRERELLDLIARGRDNAQAAAVLGLSDKTVRNHVTSIFRKLGVESRAQAIVLARECGLGI